MQKHPLRKVRVKGTSSTPVSEPIGLFEPSLWSKIKWIKPAIRKVVKM
jgi:hypothetical protein